MGCDHRTIVRGWHGLSHACAGVLVRVQLHKLSTCDLQSCRACVNCNLAGLGRGLHAISQPSHIALRMPQAHQVACMFEAARNRAKAVTNTLEACMLLLKHDPTPLKKQKGREREKAGRGTPGGALRHGLAHVDGEEGEEAGFHLLTPPCASVTQKTKERQ